MSVLFDVSATQSDVRVNAGGTTDTSGADCYTPGTTWEEFKIHFNTVTGLVEFWCAGSDFSGAPDLSATDGTPVTDNIEGIQIENDNSCSNYSIDNIRVYNLDPDA